MMKKAFTLMEVNLAIMVMAGGILAVVSLFSFGYRENRQSREDVEATVYADAVLSRLTMAIGATNVTWDAFNSIDHQPSRNHWGDYLENGGERIGKVISNPDSKARQAYAEVMGCIDATDVNKAYPSDNETTAGLKAGLVIIHDKNSPIVKIGFRAARHANELLTMPMFFTEVRFQGVPKLSEGASNP